MFAFGGRGVLTLLRVPIDGRAALLLGPSITQALWACLLGLIAMFRQPVRPFAAMLWILTAGLAIYGRSHRARAPQPTASVNDETGGSPWVIPALCVALPVLTLLPLFAFGLADYQLSGYLDGWAYTAYGQYLWHYARGVEGGLAPLYQWASHLSGTRHIAAAQLGPLSYLASPGDVQSATGLLFALALFTSTSACAALARLRKLPLQPTIVYLLVAGAAGWLLNICWAQNYDNLLAIVYFPAIMALLSDDRLVDARSSWVLVGLLLAGLIYTYPELAPIVVICLGPIVALRLWAAKRWRNLANPIIAIAVCGAVGAPYLPHALAFLLHQFGAGIVTGGPRPGDGYFLGLNAAAHRISGLWGLGGEHQIAAWGYSTTVVGVILFALLAAGIVRLLRQGEPGLPLTVCVVAGAAGIFLFQKSYPYGAYKFIVMGWWAFAFVLVTGAEWLKQLPKVVRGPVSAIGLLCCLGVPLATTIRVVNLVAEGPRLTMARYRQSAKAATLAGDRTIAVVVKSILARHWAVYFLRDSRIRVLYLDGYLGMPHVRGLLDRSSPSAWEGTRLVLTDTGGASDPWTVRDWTLIWGTGSYSLWDTRDRGWALVTDAVTPNGFERVDGRPFFWIGGGPTTFTVLAERAGQMELAARFSCGPRLGVDVSACRLEVDGAGEPRIETIGNGDWTLTIPVRSGENQLSLTAADAAIVPASPKGDPRALMVGVHDPRMRWVPNRDGVR